MGRILFIRKEIIIKLTIPINYPNKPHTVKVKYPIFANKLNYNIHISDYFKDNLWNPTNTIEYTIQNIQNIHNILFTLSSSSSSSSSSIINSSSSILSSFFIIS